MRNRNTIELLGLWETIYNPISNPPNSTGLEKQAGLNSFILTPKKSCAKINAMAKQIVGVVFLLLTVSILSCSYRSVLTVSETNAAPTPSEIPQTNKKEIVESFSDDSKIARPGKNKLQIDIVEGNGVDSANRPNNVAVIKFYSITPTKDWELKQTLEIETHALMDADPQIEDFNNDGFRDVTFVSNTAARGANEVRTLLIYDKNKDELIHIKNSEDYPNLAYNKKLNCIDSWMFHSSTTTVFLRLDGDELKEFASVSTGPERVVTVTDKNGKEREIRREKMREEDIYTRYESYNPPK